MEKQFISVCKPYIIFLFLFCRNSCSKCHNALLMIRLCCEHFVENYPEDICLSFFNDGEYIIQFGKK